MASTTQTDPPHFTFVLEYMALAMVIEAVRPVSYNIFASVQHSSLSLVEERVSCDL